MNFIINKIISVGTKAVIAQANIENALGLYKLNVNIQKNKIYNNILHQIYLFIV